MTQSGATLRLAEKLRQKHAFLKSWPMAALACGVTTDSGAANPKLAEMIATQGYEPPTPKVRARLHLPPICQECGRRQKPQAEPWVTQAADFLAAHERVDQPLPNEPRVYGRFGKRVRFERN